MTGIGSHPARSVDEQLDGLVVQRERRHLPSHLAGDPDRLTTRCQQRQPRTGAQQRGDQRSTRIQKVLTVVQQHQHPTVSHEPDERLCCGAARLIRQAEGTCHRDWHQVGVGDRRQVDIPDSVTEIGGHLPRDLDGQTGLTGTAGAGQGDQPVGDKGLPHVVNLRAAADKTGELHR